MSTKGVLFYYPNDHIKNADFRERFKEAIADCITNPSNTDSQVLETISGRGSLFEIIQKDELMRRLAALTSECDYNDTSLKDIVGTISDNEKRARGNWLTPTVRLRMTAAELLVTWRYLDKPQSFYVVGENCLRDLIEMNSQLNAWDASPDNTQEWIRDHLGELRNNLRGFKKRILNSSKELASRP